jgi:voltage-gated sodium channel
VPFIVVATFTILNLFIGIIVSTMQELSVLPDANAVKNEATELLERLEADIKSLRGIVDKQQSLAQGRPSADEPGS